MCLTLVTDIASFQVSHDSSLPLQILLEENESCLSRPIFTLQKIPVQIFFAALISKVFVLFSNFLLQHTLHQDSPMYQHLEIQQHTSPPLINFSDSATKVSPVQAVPEFHRSPVLRIPNSHTVKFLFSKSRTQVFIQRNHHFPFLLYNIYQIFP